MSFVKPSKIHLIRRGDKPRPSYGKVTDRLIHGVFEVQWYDDQDRPLDSELVVTGDFDYTRKTKPRKNPEGCVKMKVFRWSTPAPNWDGTIPKPWRGADAQALRDILAHHGYSTRVAYVEHEGAHNLYVGLRDNRNAAEHDRGLIALARLLRRLKLGTVKMVSQHEGWSGKYSGIRLLDPLRARKRAAGSYRKKNPRHRR